MDNRVKFGDCLAELLQAREWSAARLAKSLNIDASYVRRWIRGERTPALHAAYIPQISHALTDGLDRDFRSASRAALLTVLTMLEERTGLAGETAARTIPAIERVERVLREAQRHTLMLDVAARRTNHSDERTTHVMELLTRLHRQAPPAGTRPQAPMIPAERGLPRVVVGRDRVLLAAVNLIRAAVQADGQAGEREICFTLQSEREHFDNQPDLYGEWHAAIRQALERGWNIRQICRLTRNLERSLRLVTQIMDWANERGEYALYYMHKYGVHQPPFEIIQASGHGALLCFAGTSGTEIETALYIDEAEAAPTIGPFVRQMLHSAEPLVRKLDMESYFLLNAAKDGKGGDHLLCYRDISYLTVPLDLMAKYVQRSIPDVREQEAHMGRIRAAVESFYRDIRAYRMCHMYPLRVFEQLAGTGAHPHNYFLRPMGGEAAAHLRHLIGLLTAYEKFEIALVTDEQLGLLGEAEWEVKGDHTIMIGVPPKSGTAADSVDLLTISEGTIVGAFQEYYGELWERINPFSRDKENVIRKLEQLIATMA
ncbi:helix-turn-helix domain-containing protein [Cohnella caldifontis]|uniref:helix-turn-helix domain-containing protein n=1 Tax=Cohnella caldifontis TaxID=3027471 RepID=UPI0023ED4E37|nr:helix-turn-helix transcriptional regulator [Cohnella sp. YIM B05605]